MVTSNNSSSKYIVGLVILAISGLLFGAVVGYYGSHFILEKTILNQMKNDGYVYTGDATATSEDIIGGKAAYVNGELINGTAIRFDTSDATATADYILQGKTAYVNGQLVIGTIQVIPASEITPSSDSKNLMGNVYLSGDIVIKGDKNLVSSNIKYGESIYGVYGSYTPAKTETEDGGNN